jgi:hypothetical protein
MVGVTKKNVKNSEKDADKAKKSEEKWLF